MLDDYLAARRTATEDGHRPLAEETRAHRCVRRPGRAEPQPARRRGRAATTATCTAPREYFHTYLQSLDVERAGLPEAFQAKLAKALGHYGVTEPGPLTRARSRGVPDLPGPATRRPLTPWSSRRCCGPGCGSRRRARPCASPSAWPSSGWSPPPRSASPWSPTWPAAWCSPGSASRCCAATAPASTPTSATTCVTWTRNPDAPERAERIAAMVRSTEPLVRLLGQRLVRDDLDNTVMLEVLTRRYYGNKDLAGVRTTEVAGCRSWSPSGSARASCRPGSASTALGRRALRGLAELASDGDALDADIYLAWENQPGDSDAMAAVLSELVNAQPAAGPGPPAHVHGRGPRRRGDAPALHVPPVGHRDGRGAADPRPAPVHRVPDEAGAAAASSTSPGCRPRTRTSTCSCARPARTRRTNAWSRSRRSAT